MVNLVATAVAKSALSTVSIKSPYVLVGIVSQFTSSFNADYSLSGNQLGVKNGEIYTLDSDINAATYSIESRLALQTHLAVIATPVMHVKPTTAAAIIQRNATQKLELLMKSLCCIEASIASSNTAYKSINEALESWGNALNAFDYVLNLAQDIDEHLTYKELRNVRALFVADTQYKAPQLNRLVYRAYHDATPSVVIAYDAYEDVTRAQEIIDRNHIVHPGFILSGNVELLRE